MLLTAVTITAVAGYTIARVHDGAADRNELRVLLGELQTAAQSQSELEWQAIAEQRLTPALAEERRKVNKTIDRLADRLVRLDPAGDHARAVRDALRSHGAAVDREFALLAKGQVEPAKEVDEPLGHHYGDHLLIQVSERLRGVLREVDTVARLGGDEFAVLLPKIAFAEGATAVAEKLRASFDDPFLLEGLTLDVEASIGLALYPDHGKDVDQLLQHADIAMYAAKETHAGFMLFDPKLDQHSPRRLALLGELRRAIEQQQLLLHYQPKVDVHTGEVLAGVSSLR